MPRFRRLKFSKSLTDQLGRDAATPKRGVANFVIALWALGNNFWLLKVVCTQWFFANEYSSVLLLIIIIICVSTASITSTYLNFMREVDVIEAVLSHNRISFC